MTGDEESTKRRLARSAGSGVARGAGQAVGKWIIGLVLAGGLLGGGAFALGQADDDDDREDGQVQVEGGEDGDD